MTQYDSVYLMCSKKLMGSQLSLPGIVLVAAIVVIYW